MENVFGRLYIFMYEIANRPNEYISLFTIVNSELNKMSKKEIIELRKSCEAMINLCNDKL